MTTGNYYLINMTSMSRNNSDLTADRVIIITEKSADESSINKIEARLSLNMRGVSREQLNEFEDNLEVLNFLLLKRDKIPVEMIHKLISTAEAMRKDHQNERITLRQRDKLERELSATFMEGLGAFLEGLKGEYPSRDYLYGRTIFEQKLRSDIDDMKQYLTRGSN